MYINYLHLKYYNMFIQFFFPSLYFILLLRYLRKTFSYVYEYTKPDVIVFLGDLFDEGSKATRFEYGETFNRFSYIFHETKYTKVSLNLYIKTEALLLVCAVL